MATFEEGISETAMVLRRTGPMTRAELADRTGLSRSAVNLRIEPLLEAGLVQAGAAAPSGRGRPAAQFSFNDDRGRLLVADLGVNQLSTSITDLGGRILAEQVVPADVAEPPEDVLTQVMESFRELLVGVELDLEDVAGIGMSVPAPVRAASGVSVAPPIMPLWNNYDVSRWFAAHFDGPVFLDKDANAMAYGESRTCFSSTDHLMLVKVSTGVGSGMVHHGRLFRGADGAAGDFGHTRVASSLDREGVLCKCGNTDCLEAHAGGWALVRDLRDEGADIATHQDLLALIRAADPATIARVRRAGRLIGMGIATAVNLLNPTVIVLAGSVAAAGGDTLLAGVRELVYQRSLPLATANLRILASTLDPRAGLVGLAHLVTDELLRPTRITSLLARAAPRG